MPPASFSLWTVLGSALVGALCAFLANYSLNRLTKRQDRRLEWYDDIDGSMTDILHRLDGIAKELARMEAATNDFNKALYRLSILEEKMGMLWRSVEKNLTRLLDPNPPLPRSRRPGG